MNKNYFKIIRGGINTTFQDQGRKIPTILVFHLVEQWITEIIY